MLSTHSLYSDVAQRFAQAGDGVFPGSCAYAAFSWGLCAGLRGPSSDGSARLRIPRQSD